MIRHRRSSSILVECCAIAGGFFFEALSYLLSKRKGVKVLNVMQVTLLLAASGHFVF